MEYLPKILHSLCVSLCRVQAGMTKSQAERAERRNLIYGIFWCLNLPVVTYLYLQQPDIWDKVSVLYLVYVSIIALIIGAFGNRQSAKARQRRTKRRDELRPHIRKSKDKQQVIH